MAVRLHYIFDPLCGWCYAVAPFIQSVREAAVMPIVLHGGGMLIGHNRPKVTADFRDHVMSYDQRIHALTGQPFGDAYSNGLLLDTSVVYDSEPPTIAILAAESLAGRGLEMLAAIQQAHYVGGRKIGELEVLTTLAADLVLDGFKAQWEIEAGKVDVHFQESHQWLTRVGGQGYPTFAVERDGKFVRLDTNRWLGKPAAFVEALKKI